MALACAMAGGAQAQTAVGGIEVRGASAGGLSLTAPADGGSRLNLTPLETPASIEILSGDAIRAKGDLALSDAIARSTGVVQQNNPGNGSTASFAARGFSGVGSVKILLDGMSLFVGAGTVTFPFDTWTVDRVEVLKGPASVMFGQGAIGGSVNVVPKRPSFTGRTYDFQVGVGSFRTYRIGVGTGGPLSDTVAYRVDASRVGSDGYVDRGGNSSWALSGAITWRPRENLSFTVSDDYGDQKPMRYFGVPLIGGKVDDRSRELNYNVFDAVMRFKDNAGQLRAEWEPSAGVKVRNSLYLLNTKRQWRNAESYFYDPASRTVDRTDYIPIQHDERQIGDTFDLSFKGRLGAMENNLLVGAEANRIRFEHTNDGFPGTTVTLPVFDFQPGLYDERGDYRPRFRTRSRQEALFAEDQLKITPQVSLVGGLRYDHYRVRRQDLVAGREVVNKTLQNTSWRLGAVYQPTPNLSLYAQYATGSDHLGSLVTMSAGQVPFELSTGHQYEAGVKGLFLGGRGEWTVAAYKIVKNKLLTRVSTSPTLTQQVGRRSSKGLEASVAVQLGGGWSLDANGTVLEARYDDFTDFVSGVGVSRNGKTPPNVPEKSGNLWLSWRIVPAVRLYGGVRYVGRQYGDNANSAALILPAYTVVDAGLEWRLRDNLALNAQLFNAFDEVYGTNAYNDEQWILGKPRSFEVRLNGRF
ncbi:MAG TPA: TonB-dependent siderophore receptor [Caulobacteraceae bacterium]|nr:TonB-dependent siderophore receptor [Caulobacteraceae bacterium]